MRWFSNLTIAKKLTVGFGAVLLATSGLGAFSMLKMSDLNHDTTELSHRWLPACTAAISMKNSVTALRNQGFQLILATSPEEVERAERDAADSLNDLNRHKDAIVRVAASPEEKELVGRIGRLLDACVTEQHRAAALVKSGKEDEAIAVNKTSGRAAADALRAAIDEEVELNLDGSASQATQADEGYTAARTWVAAALAASAAFVILLGIVIARAISNPLKALTLAATKLTEGDVDQRVDYQSSDETGLLAESFRGTMLDAISTNFTQFFREPEQSLAEVRMIVISTEGSQSRLAEIKHLGAAGILRKPFTPEQLKSLVEQILEPSL